MRALVAQDELAVAIEPLKRVLPVAQGAGCVIEGFKWIAQRLEIHWMEPRDVFRLAIGKVVHERRADHAKSLVQSGQVFPYSEPVWPLGELVAVEKHPPDVVGPVPK